MIEYSIHILLLLILFSLLYVVRKVRTMYYEIGCMHDFAHDMDSIVSLFEEYIVHVINSDEDSEGVASNMEAIRKWDFGDSEE